MRMGHATREAGKRTSSTDGGASAGPTEASTMENTLKVRSRDKEDSRGRTAPTIKGSGSLTRWRAAGSLGGLTGGCTKANTLTTRETARA